MSVTAPDTDHRHGAIVSLSIADNPDGGQSLNQIEATRPVKIVGWNVGDTAPTGNSLHQFIRAWLGGTDPFDGSWPHLEDNSGMLFEYDVTQNDSPANGVGYADNDASTIVFPEPYHFYWGEGVTLNVLFADGGGSDNDVMDVTFYYVPVDHDGGGGSNVRLA